MCAVALNGGHVARALDFYDMDSKYFIVGGTNAWEDEKNPPAPNVTDFKLEDVIGLKKVDNCDMIIPVDSNGDIQYRGQSWKKVTARVSTSIVEAITENSNKLVLDSIESLTVNSKIRVNSKYDRTITGVTGNTVTLNEAIPEAMTAGTIVEGGAIVEGAKYVYIDAYLSYDAFPLDTFRQIGVCTKVSPSTLDIILPDQLESLGILEILDNRTPVNRSIDTRELLSCIIEF